MDTHLTRVISESTDDFFAEVHQVTAPQQPGVQGYAPQGVPQTQHVMPPPSPVRNPQVYQNYGPTIQSHPVGEQRFAALPTDSQVMAPGPTMLEPPKPPQQQMNRVGSNKSLQGFNQQPWMGPPQGGPSGGAFPPDQVNRPKSIGRYNPLLNNPNIQVQNQLQKGSYPPPPPNNPFQGQPQPSHNDSMADNSRLSNTSRGNPKSPLRTNVLNAIPGLSVEGGRRSASGRIIRDNDYPDDVQTLKITYLARADELKHLNEQIAILEGRTKQESMPHTQTEQEIARLEKEYNDLITQNNLMQRELEQAKAQVRNTKNEFDLKLANMKSKLNESAQKNMEMYERELMFKYRNNDDETLKFLREKLAKLEK